MREGGGFPGVSAFWAGTGPKVSKAICGSLHLPCRVMQSLLPEPFMLLGGCWLLHSLTQSLCRLQMVESASKGMILMYAKEAILKVLNKAEVNPGAPLQLLFQVQRSLCLPCLELVSVARAPGCRCMLMSRGRAGLAGAAAGAGGGLCQVSIMGPMTYLVTGQHLPAQPALVLAL